MSAVVAPAVDRESVRVAGDCDRRPALGGVHAGGRLTLEQRLDCVWEGLHAGGAGECPVCGAVLTRGHDGRTARCAACGSILA